MPIFVCFDLVLYLMKIFLQKGAPSTALQNSEPAADILENSAEAKQVHQKETLFVLDFLLHTVCPGWQGLSFPIVFSFFSAPFSLLLWPLFYLYSSTLGP